MNNNILPKLKKLINPQFNSNHSILVVHRLGLLMLMYLACRIFFLIFNWLYLQQLHLDEFCKLFLLGFRFDLAAIVLSNFIFIILSILPGNLKNKGRYQNRLKTLFILVNSLLITINIIDIEYFKYNFKRSIFQLNFISGISIKQILNILPGYICSLWYIVVIAILLILCLFKFYPKYVPKSNHKRTNYIKDYAILFIGVFTSFLAIRGLSKKPLNSFYVARYVPVEYSSLALNSTFSIYESLLQHRVQPTKLLPDYKLKKLFSPEKQFSSRLPCKSDNVIVIILESFSKEYIGIQNEHLSVTPFLDSLIKKSLFCNHAFANGRTSINALPTILASLPPLTDIPFILSEYSTDTFSSLPNILQKQGYHTSFFHGGEDGIFGFESFAIKAGFMDYFGKKDYNNNIDFDGTWGIYDEEFLKYSIEKLDSIHEPFLGCIFTLSLHSPFAIPKKYKNKFLHIENNLLKSIAYTDFSLHQFFDLASKQPWFSNTLFVLTADHASFSFTKQYQNLVGNFSIPIIYYKTGTLIGNYAETTQQLDIMPSILDYLNYKSKFTAYGNSIFHKNPDRFAITYCSGIYQLIQDDYVLINAEGTHLGYYNIKKDSALMNNLLYLPDNKVPTMDSLLNGIIQTYISNLSKHSLTTKYSQP